MIASREVCLKSDPSFSIHDIEEFERPSTSQPPLHRARLEKQLEELRVFNRNSTERLYDLYAWQFQTLVEDKTLAEDHEMDTASSSDFTTRTAAARTVSTDINELVLARICQ